MPSTDSAEEKIPAVVSLCCVGHAHNLLYRLGAQLGSERCGLRKMPAGAGLCGAGALARVRHRQQIRIRMLNLGQTLRRLHNPLQAFVVKFVGGGPRRASAEHRPHRNRVVFFRHILMDDVVGEAGEGALAAIEEDFHFVGGGVLA